MNYLKTRGWLGYALLAAIIAAQATIIYSLKDSAVTAGLNVERFFADGVVRPDVTAVTSELPTTPLTTPPSVSITTSNTTPKSALEELEHSCDNILKNFAVRITDRVKNGKTEFGTGVIINGSEILTAFHVVKRQGQIRGEFADGSTFGATFIGSNRSKDLALLKLEGDSSKFAHSIEIATSTPKDDEDVCAVGSPFGNSLRVAIGKVLTVNNRGDVLITAGLLRPGDSGGPLINRAGALVGLNKAVVKLKDKRRESKYEEGTGVAVDPESIREFLAEYSTTRKS